MFLGSWHYNCSCFDGSSATVSVPSLQHSLTAGRIDLGLVSGLSPHGLTTSHTAVPRLRGPHPSQHFLLLPTPNVSANYMPSSTAPCPNCALPPDHA